MGELQNTGITKVEAVYRYLWEGIVSGDIPQGRRLIIREIANKLGVSDIPVREALQRLRADGFIEMTPYAGAVVTSLSPETMEEVLVIRGALEPLAASLSAPHLGTDDIQRLETLLEAMRKAADSGDYRQYSKLNREFHATMYSHCPYKMLLEMVTEMWNRSERARALFKVNPTSLLESLSEHCQMLKAIKEADYDFLVAVVNKQRSRVRKESQEALARTKDPQGEGALGRNGNP